MRACRGHSILYTLSCRSYLISVRIRLILIDSDVNGVPIAAATAAYAPTAAKQLRCFRLLEAVRAIRGVGVEVMQMQRLRWDIVH